MNKQDEKHAQEKVKAIYKILEDDTEKPKGLENLPIEFAVKAATAKHIKDFHADGALVVFFDCNHKSVQVVMEGELPPFAVKIAQALVEYFEEGSK